MKICIFTHNLRRDNGAGVFSRRLVERLRKNPLHTVIVFTNVASGELYEQPLLTGFFGFLGELRGIRAVLKGCDVIHALDAFPYGVIAVLASLGLSKKVIITAVGTGSINPLHHMPYAWLLRFCYRHADRVTAISNFTKDEILKVIPGITIEVITHGVDIREFQSASDPESEKRAASFKPYVLSVGTLRWRKGYHRSIGAFALVAKQFPSLKYVIVGKRHSGDYYERLQLLVKTLGLEGRVVFEDGVERAAALAEFYRHAELFCLMSQNQRYDVEGFGLVFLEAAAASLPVVGTKGGGIPDAVWDGKNGILVPESDEGAFADAIVRILSDEKLRGTMASESLELARMSSWGEQLDRYESVYRALAVTR